MAEFLKTPISEQQVLELFGDLEGAFLQRGISIDPDPEFGALTKEYFGLNLDDLALDVNLGFMQIIFNPDASWQVLVPQSALGRRSLHTLAKILNRPIDEAKIDTWEINYACYTYFFPHQPQETSS